MRSPWDNSTRQPRPRFKDEYEEEEEEEEEGAVEGEGVFKPKEKKVRVKKTPPSPEPVIAPKCDACGRRRRSVGPCWFCGDELQEIGMRK